MKKAHGKTYAYFIISGSYLCVFVMLDTPNVIHGINVVSFSAVQNFVHWLKKEQYVKYAITETCQGFKLSVSGLKLIMLKIIDTVVASEWSINHRLG